MQGKQPRLSEHNCACTPGPAGRRLRLHLDLGAGWSSRLAAPPSRLPRPLRSDSTRLRAAAHASVQLAGRVRPCSWQREQPAAEQRAAGGLEGSIPGRVQPTGTAAGISGSCSLQLQPVWRGPARVQAPLTRQRRAPADFRLSPHFITMPVGKMTSIVLIGLGVANAR